MNDAPALKKADIGIAMGILVADSVPALEWEETMNKARAMFRAAAMLG